jgi:hypothetical protein
MKTMIKAIGLTLIYAVGVAVFMNHFFGPEVINEVATNNNNQEMAKILFSLPGVYFVLDYWDRRHDSQE